VNDAILITMSALFWVVGMGLGMPPLLRGLADLDDKSFALFLVGVGLLIGSAALSMTAIWRCDCVL
jgi:hypothetical protein